MTREYRMTVRDGTGMDFVLSDGSLDRHGTRINPKGWKLDSFNRNPQCMWAHGREPALGTIPVGNWKNVRTVGDKLIGTLSFAEEGTHPVIDSLRKLIEQGLLRAVSVGFNPLKLGEAGKSQYDFEEQELFECSLCAIPSNPNALAKARALNISDETLILAFGEQAVTRRDLVTTGEHAVRTPAKAPLKMKTLAQRIEETQANLTARRDRLVALNQEDTLDIDAIEALNAEIETDERTLAALKTSEARIGIAGAPSNVTPAAAATPGSPAVLRRPLGFPRKEVRGLDLFVRAAVVKGLSHFGDRPVEKVLDERYPGHEQTAMMCRADQTLGTTTVSGWASEIVQTAYADFLQALQAYSIYPALRDRGIGLSFDGVGTVSIPSRTAGGAGGGFFAEGAPIRVGRITTAATTMTVKKMGVIVPFSRELVKRSTPSIEALVRQAILEDTAEILDTLLLDATAASTARPAGLLNGVSAAATGYGGGDFEAVVADFKALLQPFYTANAADNITVIMNPIQGLALSMMPGPGDGRFGWADPLMRRLTILESTRAEAGRLIAIRNSDFATAIGDAPEFDISEQATIHMEDTTALEIVSGTGPATADPVRSLWQTGAVGVRMIMDLSWKMRRSGMVQWIDGTSW